METYWAGVELGDGGEFTIRLRGDIDMAARPVLRELVDACVEAGATMIRFDMTDVELCGSDCVYLLLYTARHVPVRVRPSRQVLRTLEMVGVAPEVVTVEHP